MISVSVYTIAAMDLYIIHTQATNESLFLVKVSHFTESVKTRPHTSMNNPYLQFITGRVCNGFLYLPSG